MLFPSVITIPIVIYIHTTVIHIFTIDSCHFDSTYVTISCNIPFHYPYRLSSLGSRGAGADPSWHRAKAGDTLDRPPVHPGHRQTTIHAQIHTYGQLRDQLTWLHVFGLWEEAGEPGGNHGENMQTPHWRIAPPGIWTHGPLAVRRQC